MTRAKELASQGATDSYTDENRRQMALERIAVVLRDDNFSRFLKRAKDRSEIAELLAEADEKFGSSV